MPGSSALAGLRGPVEALTPPTDLSVAPKLRQIVDSTPMLCAAATQGTVRLVRHGVRGLIDAVVKTDEEAARVLVNGLAFDYEKPGEKRIVAGGWLSA